MPQVHLKLCAFVIIASFSSSSFYFFYHCFFKGKMSFSSGHKKDFLSVFGAKWFPLVSLIVVFFQPTDRLNPFIEKTVVPASSIRKVMTFGYFKLAFKTLTCVDAKCNKNLEGENSVAIPSGVTFSVTCSGFPGDLV